ncbi:MAG: glycosyltransferase [Bacteroidaceae bacterium]|nr:glycosyltransferase [Bacteroidaceae bacterium]MBR1800879.1 glycosyltransferase [Bacteroidaceae bacterium]
MRYSIIVPVYNRPQEVAELLQSLTKQTFRDFDVHIVEDGSDVACREVCDHFANRVDLHYYVKENGGPGAARNYGAERATGDYLIVLDSDVVLPPGYLAAIERELEETPCDAFGGPDRAHPDFSPIQKAISYAMTSFFTTGGIRGGSSARRGKRGALDRFYPRSFNMGVSRALWQRLGGFRQMRFGEDIDFSYRICEAGASCRLFPEAWVWHKRRTDFGKFFRQVKNSGTARINLHLLHPGTMKLVHLLPALFTVGCLALTILFCFGLVLFLFATDHMSQAFGFALCELTVLFPLLYALLIFVDSSVRNRSLWVGLLSVPASFIQLLSYGSGFLSAVWHRLILREQGEGFDDNQKLYK